MNKEQAVGYEGINAVHKIFRTQISYRIRFESLEKALRLNCNPSGNYFHSLNALHDCLKLKISDGSYLALLFCLSPCPTGSRA